MKHHFKHETLDM